MRPPVVRAITLAVLFASSIAHMLGSSARAWADESVAADALAPGSWSVQFSVQPNFTLGSYSGSTLSLKRHLASGNAIRFGLSVGFSRGGDDFADVIADTFSTRSQLAQSDLNSVSIGVGAYYLWYSGKAAPLHAYWGAGPTVGWSRGHDDRTQALTQVISGQPPNAFTVVDDATSRSWQVGVAGALGVEWLVARRVGVFAEYGSSLGYTDSKFTRRQTVTSTSSAPSTGQTRRDIDSWGLSGSGGRLGISAYY